MHHPLEPDFALLRPALRAASKAVHRQAWRMARCQRGGRLAALLRVLEGALPGAERHRVSGAWTLTQADAVVARVVVDPAHTLPQLAAPLVVQVASCTALPATVLDRLRRHAVVGPLANGGGA
jgi:hypothetical protein